VIGHIKACIGQRNPLRLGYHALKAFVAAMLYGFPARNLTVIGITGTDGKTTTVSMLAHILRATGKRTGIVSTAFFDDGSGSQENPSHLTSINPFILQRQLRSMVHNGCTHAVIEYSSHGLVQHRLDWTWPSVAAITNTALEHLDYHGSMEQYRQDKSLLFRMLREHGTAVLNARDETYASYVKIPALRRIVWNDPAGGADDVLWATHLAASPSACSATLHHQHNGMETTSTLQLSIPGIHNIENAQCATACALSMGIAPERTCSTLVHFSGIPGRLERIDCGQPFSVYVDFAVSPQSYQRALETLRMIAGTQGRVLVLCSSCGNRMREKRPEIGRVCSLFADVVVVTEDETYGEDPHAVLEEVWAGVDQSRCEARKIFDRRAAIAFVLQQAKSGDAIAICGMGPFSTMTKLEGRVPWDEREVGRGELRKIGWSQ
jgi:UDP-N-acetylmuramoyl-L-alanyl-D-glutamate--2,6-diaminopimelate ligase